MFLVKLGEMEAAIKPVEDKAETRFPARTLGVNSTTKQDGMELISRTRYKEAVENARCRI